MRAGVRCLLAAGTLLSFAGTAMADDRDRATPERPKLKWKWTDVPHADPPATRVRATTTQTSLVVTPVAAHHVRDHDEDWDDAADLEDAYRERSRRQRHRPRHDDGYAPYFSVRPWYGTACGYQGYGYGSAWYPSWGSSWYGGYSGGYGYGYGSCFSGYGRRGGFSICW